MSTSPVEALYPLTPSQQGMLLETLAFPASGRQIEQFLWQWQGDLNRPAYERAWQQILMRHSSLRTGFLWKDQPEPLQFVLRQPGLQISWQDWRAASPAESAQRLEEFLRADRVLGFNLGKVPLMRLAILQLGEQSYQAIWTTHHILLDGWALPIVLREVHEVYLAECAGRALRLPPVRPYSDYVGWLQRQDTAVTEAFWRKRLQGFRSATPLAPARLAPAEATGFGEHELLLPASLLQQLRTLARQSQVTLSTVMQGAWSLLLARYSGAAEVLFGITVSGRPAALPGVETMVGLFINTVPLRAEVIPEQTLSRWLQALAAQTLEQQSYEYAAAGQIHQWSEVPPTFRLYDSLLVFENYPLPTAPAAGQPFTVSEVRSIGAQTQYPLTITVFPHEGLHVKFVYSRAAFTAADVERLALHLKKLLAAAVADCSLAALLQTIPQAEVPAVAAAPVRAAAARQFVPPLNAVEQALVQLWQKLFNLPSVSTHDNFYDFGGHSLLAIRLVGQIRQQFGIQLPISALLLNPTIARLAKLIQDVAKGTSADALFSALVPVQPNGKKPPFFLAPGAGGTIFYMYYLARYMDPEQPFYGLQAAGLDGQSSPHTTVEAMAAHFLAEIKRLQPHGPYYLGGHSFGSFIAYEMAQRLLKAGEQVACLILFDTEAPHLVKRLQHETTAQWIAEYVVTFEEVLADKIVAPYEPPSSPDADAQWAQFAGWLRANNIMAAGEEVTIARHLLEVFKLQLQMPYEPKDVVPMRAVIFRATDWENDTRSAKLGWDALQVEPEIHLVPGNHMTFIGEPHIQVVAAKLSECLSRARLGN